LATNNQKAGNEPDPNSVTQGSEASDPSYWWPDGEPPEGFGQRLADIMHDDDMPPEMSEEEILRFAANAAEQQLQETEQEAKDTFKDLPIRVLRILREVLAATHGMDFNETHQLVSRVTGAEKIFSLLNETDRVRMLSAMEVISHEASVLTSGRLDLTNLPVKDVFDEEVQVELDRIAEISAENIPPDPHAAWSDLVEVTQRYFARKAALRLASAIEGKEPTSKLMELFKKLEAPTSRKSATRARMAISASELSRQRRAETAGKVLYRVSSGLPTLDKVFTNKGQSPGFISPGQFIVVVGPTGTGKSSFSYSITPAISADLRNWGFTDAKQMFFHTEEDSIDKLQGFRMDLGQKFSHLSDNLIIAMIGTSRKAMCEMIYDTVMEADVMARTTKRPITDFLPYVIQLDYLQSLQEQGEDPTDASRVTAEFLMRGVREWDPEEMEKFSGVSYREYAGAAWPSGMEHHSTCVIAYAQIRKPDPDKLFYTKGKNLEDFVVVDEAGNPSWELHDGDMRIFTKSMIHGSAVIGNHADQILFLHRSKPEGNPSVTGEDGVPHLVDTRARLLFSKARTGQTDGLSYAPMVFDVQPSGFRAQYFDVLAERAIERGVLTKYDPIFSETGDPILPVRPVADPLETCRY